MRYRSSFVALLLVLCAQATVRANTTYNLTFGAYSNESLQYTGNNYISGYWTEANGGTYGSGEQIVCMVTNSTTTNTCGNPGPGTAQHIPIYTPPSNYAIWGGTSTSTYLEDDGDPAYGAPIYTDLDAANGDALVLGDSYTLSFYQASNEEGGNKAAYNDYWQVYLSDGTGAGSYICPSSVCGTAVGSGTLAFTSPVMQNPGTGASTPWVLVTYTFTATSTDEILEFVTEAINPAGEATPTNFNPPFLDLAAITLTHNTPEPGTWALTILGLGGACVAGRLRRRRSSSAAMKRLQQG